jgi:energy-converting hydrogenase Eha subunit E
LPARVHIGLVVLGSIASGLAAGAVLDLLIFDGSSETTITGLALLSLAFDQHFAAITSVAIKAVVFSARSGVSLTGKS